MPITIEAKDVEQLKSLVNDLFPDLQKGDPVDNVMDAWTCSLADLTEIARRRFSEAGFTMEVSQVDAPKAKLKQDLEASLEAEGLKRQEVQAEAEDVAKKPVAKAGVRPKPKTATTNGKAVQAEEAETAEDPEEKKAKCIKKMMDLYARDAEGAVLVKGMLQRYGNGAKKFVEIDVSQFDAIAKELDQANA